MEIGLERFVQAAAAVLDIDPEQLVPAIKVSLAESAIDEVFRAVAARSLAEDDFADWLREHVEKAST
jgi:hypothetical protein